LAANSGGDCWQLVICGWQLMAILHNDTILKQQLIQLY